MSASTGSEAPTSPSPEVGAAPAHRSGVGAGRGVHHLGYRGWSGVRTSGWSRWMVISQVGVQRAWQSQWLKRMLFFAWLPAVWFGFGFFLWEQATQYPEWQQLLRQLLRNFPPSPPIDVIQEAVRSDDLTESRHLFWAGLLQMFFRYPQAVLMVLVVGLISPPLISQDIRSRAFLLYFSRPLTRSEYVLGKMGSLWTFLCLISGVPALVLYFIGVMLSPSISVVLTTWDLPLRIIGATLVLILPTSALALCISSLTKESRYAGFAWFAVWILGWFTYGAVTSAEGFNAQQAARHQQFPFPEAEVAVPSESAWTHLSLYHTLGRVQSWVFGFDQFEDVVASIAILVLLTSISLGVTYYRISAPMRV
ncbi:ABC transporter permease [Schlesneria sp. DSM 10557]|uniref:ABC transporter permease n=1 Tax=Schlesneria sp. DSM 10557 TaxID=3044399 RepID=UPI00359F419C